ncbi:MAG: 50S ribosomal protein L32e [Nitrososphaerota archaeon]|nr:50S ribosomal protein L32e [Aigarchaeota archaeon]MDW8076270.1 50S ribosomal protein L32e [Nitrososphaerota archaeon]
MSGEVSKSQEDVTLTSTTKKAKVKLPLHTIKQRRDRPKFVRQESWRYKRLDEAWRRPRGKDSRMRLQKSGAPPLVKVGYRGSKDFRGLHPSGFEEVLVSRPEELEGIDPSRQAIRIAACVGRLKRIRIAEVAREKGIKVLNPPPQFKEEAA